MILDVFSNLANALTTAVKRDVSLKSLHKEDVLDLINTNISIHNNIVNALSVRSDKEVNNWMLTVVKPALSRSSERSKDIYNEYAKGLVGKARKIEETRSLSSLLTVNKSFVKILTELKNNLDELFENKKVDIYDTRMSQVAVLGILKHSDIVANFSLYLYSFMTRVANGSTSSIPRYRDVFMKENVTKVTMITNKVVEHKGEYEFLNNIRKLRSKGADLILGANGSFSFTNFVNRGFYTPDILDTLLSAISCLNIFSAVGNLIDDYKIDRNNRNKEIKEWLENHVALLRMDLEDPNKDSKEKAKLLQIIKAYDEKIAEYDERIKKFEEED